MTMPRAKLMPVLALLLAGLAPAWAAPQPPEHLVWRHVPLSVTLQTGHERILRFPGPIKLGLPPDIHARVRAQIVGNTLYLLARKDFPPTRVIVKRRNGVIYLFDLAATGHGRTAPITVTDAQGHRASTTKAPKEPATHTTPPAVSYVALTRFAARALYAPRRLLTNPRGYTRVPLNAPRHVDLIRGATVDAEPLIGWQAGGLYVTAVKLTNRTARPIVLDPRRLRGHWRAATFQHARLLPRGSLADTTAVYLISARPFAAALAGSNPWRR